MITLLVSLLAASLAAITAGQASAQAGPNIRLSPTSGFCSVTIEGTNFSAWTGITIYWDGKEIPAIIDTDQETNFTAIITVPTQTSPGDHEVRAVDGYGDGDSAVFRVIDMTGPQGIPGASVIGPAGEDGINCWDLNENGLPDDEEDINGDGVVDVLDCRGPEGPQGPPGESTVIEGAQGPAGPEGPPGEPGEDGLSIIWRGEWNPDEEYLVNHAVNYEGSAYIATAPSSGAVPAEAGDKWDLMAVKGEAGEVGEAGEAGGGGAVGTTGFFMGLAALILIGAGKVKGWIFG